MRSLGDLTDHDLATRLTAAVAQERTQLATVLAYMAEFDGRKLYRPAGYASMFEYSIQVLHFSDDVAYKRIRVLRAVRRFPMLLRAIADGRLHLTAVVFLKHYLTRDNVGELIDAASHKTKFEVQQLLAERFPRLDTPIEISSLPAAMTCESQLVPEPVANDLTLPGRDASASPIPAAPARVEPLSPERFALQVTIDKVTHQKLERARELLGHALPSGDIAQVLDRALDLLVAKLERRKFGAAQRPRGPAAATIANPRQIPAAVRRAVAERDGHRCTFRSEDGRRCTARKLLEYDHTVPVADGGLATVENLRLRCREHNQMAAEERFGAGFMEQKRYDSIARDLRAGLGTLGYRASDIRWVLGRSETSRGATLEERMRAALTLLRPRATTIPAPLASPA